MPFHAWILLFGGLLLMVAFVRPLVRRLPITTTLLYLGVGVAVSPWGFGWLALDPLEHARWIHHAAEVGVLVSLFTVGLKLRVRWTDPVLRPAFGLAILSMVVTVGLIAWLGSQFLALPLGAAVLLGAVLAPTDPVLASDVQLKHARDRDRIRLTLSVEAGLNDGTAFPFVMLGLGLLGLHDLGDGGGRWVLADVVWATTGGLAIGAGAGYGVGRLLLAAHRRRGDAMAFGEYVVLGLVGVAYGLAVAAHTYGFLAVFAAGVALRAVERRASGLEELPDRLPATLGEDAKPSSDDPRTAPAFLAGTLLNTNEQLEHILEVALVVIVGASLAYAAFDPALAWFLPVLFLLIRPLACVPVLLACGFRGADLAAVAWFGIRGIGSLYYVMYAVAAGLSPELSRQIVGLTLWVIATSIVVHGVSASPFFAANRKRRT